MPAPDFSPCSTCGQYSHSIGEDRLAEAFRHFQSMYAHPVRGHPMGHNFDEATRDHAQVMMGAAKAERAAIVAWLRSNGPDRDNGGPCRHVEHTQGICTCSELADAIAAGSHAGREGE